MSGGVILSELFIRMFSRISSTEQMCILVIGSYVLGFMVRFSILVMVEFCFHSAFVS